MRGLWVRVVIAGGGIGGLACAQGLVADGHDVTVLDPDVDVRATGGYRLHLRPSCVGVLRDLLPDEVFGLLTANAMHSRGFTLAVRDHRGRRLAWIADGVDDLALDVDRVTLRCVLAEGLGERMRWGAACTGWQVHAGGLVEVDCDVGGSLRADVLVIADGVGSKLAHRRAGTSTSSPCGLTGIAGRTPLPRVSHHLTELLAGGPTLAVGTGGTGLFAARHVVDSAAGSGDGGRNAIPPGDVIWGLIVVDSALPQQVTRAPVGELPEIAVSVLSNNHWSRVFTEAIDAAEVSTVGAYRFHAADPTVLAPWSAGAVTALGDAVHAVPPTGGAGAATGILDAAELTHALRRADRGELALVDAVGGYETGLRVRGSVVVRESLRPVSWIRAVSGPLGGTVFRAVSPVAAGVAALVAPRVSR